jgi:cation diffusion facilitator family transporter
MKANRALYTHEMTDPTARIARAIPLDRSRESGGATTPSLTRWAWLSVLAAILTVSLKFAAYYVTGSAGLLSDAVESTVNLVAAFTALFALWYSTRPVDRSHNYGHEKIEFFAAAVEGGLILVAAAAIFWYAGDRLLNPREIESIGFGLAISLVAALVNLLVARVLLRVASQHRSIVLEADGQHLMTDVWTSVGVIAGLLLVRVSGVQWLDPIIAILIALNILRTGGRLLRTSFDGLMDRAIPDREVAAVRTAIEMELEPGVTYHALRTRRAGTRNFVDLHLLVPGSARISDAHDLANRIEAAVERTIPGSETSIHLEPLEEPSSWADSALIILERPPAFDLPDFLRVDQPGIVKERRDSGESSDDVPAAGS